MEINEKKLKRILKEHQKHSDAKFNELKRYFGVAREDFDSKVKLIAEQYDTIIEKLDFHEARLVSIEKNIEIMKVDISFIKNGLKKKVDVEEFEALERRIAILEAK